MNQIKNFSNHAAVLILSIFSILTVSDSFSQNFVKITDNSNPIVTDIFTGVYFGTSWVDVDNDGKLDLFVNRKAIYKNLGGGNFSQSGTGLQNQSANLSNTWADYNNDGYIDCWVTSTGASNSFLYRNNGDGSFTKITEGEIGDSAYNTGWGCAWGDYDNDGYTDLIIAAANNFGVVFHPNRLYHNNGDGSFSRVNMPGLTDTLAPFTVPSWNDFDQDGDMDLFIGTGPGGSAAVDCLYKNLLKETGTATLSRLNLPPLTTDLVDGQIWNVIDFDNDGDLDAFLTNYASSIPNNLYRNNNGTFEKMTAAQVGSIVSDLGLFLTNLWGDFNNDGFIDCFVTRQGGPASYYNNNGNGTFTRIDTTSLALNSGNYGAAAGDYDNNGTLDLYVTGTTDAKGLFRNDLSNGNKWINIRCIGGGPKNNLSNKSAIGTKIKAKAIINGVPLWQYREISSQNSFNSMNMLNVHIGFGNASAIDSLVIIWPRGLKEIHTNVNLNNFYIATEGQGIVSGITYDPESNPDRYSLSQNYPNPFNPSTTIKFGLSQSGMTSLKIYNILGKEVSKLVNSNLQTGSYEVKWDASAFNSGVYFYRLETDGFIETKRMLLIK